MREGALTHTRTQTQNRQHADDRRKRKSTNNWITKTCGRDDMSMNHGCVRYDKPLGTKKTHERIHA